MRDERVFDSSVLTIGDVELILAACRGYCREVIIPNVSPVELQRARLDRLSLAMWRLVLCRDELIRMSRQREDAR